MTGEVSRSAAPSSTVLGRDPAPEPDGAAFRRSRARTTAILLAGVAATSFPMSVFGASLPTVAADLGTDEITIAWVVTAPLLSLAIALPIMGKAGDLYGHLRVYLAGLAASGVLSVLTVIAWDPISLIVIRTLGQTAGAATMPTSIALVLRLYGRHERARALGWWSLIAAGSPTLGLVVGGPLIEAFGWRTLFLVQAVPELLALLLVLRIPRDIPQHAWKRTFDVLGAATFGAAAFCGLFALNRSVAWGWTHPVVMAATVLTPLLGCFFLIAEVHAPDPLIPLRFFRIRNFTIPIAATLFMSAAYWGGFILVPFLLSSTMDYAPSEITIVLVARTLAFSSCAALAGYASTWIGERWTAVVGAGCVAASFLTLAPAAARGSVLLVVIGQLLIGGGFGFCRPPYTASMANAVDESDLGVVAATQGIADRVGAATGITILTSIQGGATDPDSFVRTFTIAAIISVAPIVLSLFLKSTNRVATLPVVPVVE